MAFKYNPFTGLPDIVQSPGSGTAAISFISDSGTATPNASGAITIAGGDGISTSAAVNTVTVNLSTPVTEDLGGTGQTTYTTGDILYASGANTLSKLAIGSNGEILKIAAGIPSWAADETGGDVVGPGSAINNNFASFDGTTGKLIKDSTVSLSSFLGVSNNLSDVVSASTSRTNLGLGTMATQAASSVAITGGSITGITDLAVADGGTGRSSHTAYAVLCGGTTTTAAQQSIAGVGTSGQVLTSNGAGALPTFQAAAGGVTGPGSSTDNALARWNGTGGDTLQDSALIVSDNGEMTNASQPAFLAQQGTKDDNVTGDATPYTLGDTDIGTTLTEIFDQNSDFTPGASGGAIFTAPVTGRYFFSCIMQLDGVAAGHTAGNYYFISSNRTYNNYNVSPAAIANSSFLGLNMGTVADMDASDTMKFRINVSGSTKVVDISTSTFCSGYLIC